MLQRGTAVRPLTVIPGSGRFAGKLGGLQDFSRSLLGGRSGRNLPLSGGPGGSGSGGLGQASLGFMLAVTPGGGSAAGQEPAAQDGARFVLYLFLMPTIPWESDPVNMQLQRYRPLTGYCPWAKVITGF